MYCFIQKNKSITIFAENNHFKRQKKKRSTSPTLLPHQLFSLRYFCFRRGKAKHFAKLAFLCARVCRIPGYASVLLPGGAGDQSQDDGVRDDHGQLSTAGGQGQLFPHGDLQPSRHLRGHRLSNRGDRATGPRPIRPDRRRSAVPPPP